MPYAGSGEVSISKHAPNPLSARSPNIPFRLPSEELEGTLREGVEGAGGSGYRG